MADKDELFGDSDGDTDDLIANAKSNKPIAKPKAKKRLQKKSTSQKKEIPDADNDDDSDEDAFADSDDDDKKITQKKKLKKKSSTKSKTASSKPLTKKEKMEALAKKRANSTKDSSSKNRKERRDKDSSSDKNSSSNVNEGGKSGDKKDKGYDSGDSYNSGMFQRTKEDIDFIDNEGEDEDLVKEYNAEQHFDDERPDGESTDEEEAGGRKKKKPSSYKKRNSADVLSDLEENGDEEPSNPISAAVWRMKKNKRKKRNDEELKIEAREFLNRMDVAADEDDKAIEEKRPATKKLSMLNEVIQMLTKIEMMPHLLDLDLLIVCKRWVQPLPNKTLGNITVRQRLLQAIANMNGVSTDNLKRSGFGKVVMSLHMHPKETPAMKRQLKSLIEQWSRPIFKREGNLKYKSSQDLRRDSGITGYARAQQASMMMMNNSLAGRNRPGGSHRTTDDLTSIIKSGQQAKSSSLGNNRVQVPYSKGFQFTVKPQDKIDPAMSKHRNMGGARSDLNKRMIQKKRSKIQRSVNMSADGKGL